MSRPTTPGQLWDYAHRLFGISTWVEDTPDGSDPFWKYRQAEVGKVKRSLASRKIDLDDVVTALDYCHLNRIDIRNVTWTYEHIYPALRWRKKVLAEAAGAVLTARWEAACEAALGADEVEWHGRLVRASLDRREEVVGLWEAEHVEMAV